MTLDCVSFPNSISGAVSGANAHLSMCELVAMMVPALSFAATILECGPAPLEHDLVCGLAHVGLGPRQCAATPLLPFAAPVGLELVSGTPGDGVRACEVATVAKTSFQASSWCLSGVLGLEPCPRWMLLYASLRTWTPCSVLLLAR